MSIQVVHICKRFGSKVALNDISINFDDGKICALVGENGAGKSTLAKIIASRIECDSGKILFGKNVKIGFVEQTPLLAKNISVKQNILLGVSSTKKKQVEELKNKWCPKLNLESEVKDIGSSDRFYTSLIHCLIFSPNVLVLDEPGAYLDDEQRDNLFKNLDELKKQNVCVIVITHSKKEIIKYADSIVLLFKGCVKESFFDVQKKAQTEKNEILKVIKNSISNSEYLLENKKNNLPNFQDSKTNSNNMHFSFAVKNLFANPVDKPLISDITFSVCNNEIVLINGLAEAGIITLEDCITGMVHDNISGTFTYSKENQIVTKKMDSQVKITKQVKITPKFIRQTLNKKIGLKISMVASDKTMRSSFPELTINEALLCASNKIQFKNYNEYVNKIILRANLDVKPCDKIKSLSGGMLQRLILERELFCEPDIIILCQPFAGLDMQKTKLMWQKIETLKNQGKGILILSVQNVAKEKCDKFYKLEGGKLYD